MGKYTKKRNWNKFKSLKFTTMSYIVGGAIINIINKNNELILKQDIFFTSGLKVTNPQTPNIECLSTLTKELADLDIENWDRHSTLRGENGGYIICDGVHWKLEIRFEEESPLIREGNSKFPDNFDDFLELIDHYTTALQNFREWIKK